MSPILTLDMKTAAHSFVAVFLTGALASCSLFVREKQPVTILADEPNADIRVDGQYLGRGRATVSLIKRETHSIVATMGKRSAYTTIDYDFSTTGVLDLIGGCIILLPALGILSGGAWQLDQTHVNLHLQ